MKFRPKLVKTKSETTEAFVESNEAEMALHQRERANRVQQEVLLRDLSLPTVRSGVESSSNQEDASFPQNLRESNGSAAQNAANGIGASLFADNTALTDVFAATSGAAESAPPLPRNTLHTTLAVGEPRSYPPVALTAHEKELEEGHAGEKDFVQNDAVAGTAFLRGMDGEIERGFEFNKAFHRDVVQPATGNLQCSSEGSAITGESGALVWMQLPRLHPVPGAHSEAMIPFDLSQTPPGKIGELKVYESGKITMEINGCCFEVLAESSGSEGGSCGIAAMTTASHESDQKSSCYFLDLLQHKLVAVPSIEEEDERSCDDK